MYCQCQCAIIYATMPIAAACLRDAGISVQPNRGWFMTRQSISSHSFIFSELAQSYRPPPHYPPLIVFTSLPEHEQ